MYDELENNKYTDDEVVYETDVFLSKALSDSLCLFLYPTVFSGIEDENINCLSAKIKPKQQKVELEMDVNTKSNCYDKNKGEQIAYKIDGRNSTSESYYETSSMDKFTLIGTKSIDSTESYAVGVVSEGKLHITPLHSIIELNPDIVHMDKIDFQSKKNLNPDDIEEEEEEAVAVTVRFEGANAEKERQIREQSYQYLQQKHATEPWMKLNHHKYKSERSLQERSKLFCSQMYKNVTSESISPLDYRRDLLPECLKVSGCESDLDNDSTLLPHKPLSDQIKCLMITAYVLPFSLLMQKLPPNIDSVSVERLVQQMAVLVQGCWTVKSDLLYDEESVSSFTGISSKFLINARDYVLWLFNKSKFIIRKDVLSTIYITDEDFRNMILPIANRTRRGWEFKYPYDKEFVDSHPSIHQSQEIKWDLRYKKLVKDLGVGDTQNEASYPLPSRPRQKRISRSSMSEGDESGTDSASGCKDPKLKRAYASTTKKQRHPSSPLKCKSFQIATLDVSPTFLETAPSDDVRMELREYVGDVIRSQFCMTLHEVKDLVAKSPLHAITLRSDFDTLLEEALLECGAQKLNNKWPQNTTPEVLYAFTKFGNKQLDRYRSALLDLFSTTARTRHNLYVKKVEDELREIICEADCRQVFEEYCVYKSGFHYLKGTIPLDS